ncbi:hypothetical protein PAENIP36_70810 [Paenibacillus sp. P36]
MAGAWGHTCAGEMWDRGVGPRAWGRDAGLRELDHAAGARYAEPERWIAGVGARYGIKEGAGSRGG